MQSTMERDRDLTIDQLVAQIIEGRTEAESAADAVALCTLAAIAVGGVEEGGGYAKAPPEERDRLFVGLLQRLGKILCPLADDVKHDRKGYVEGMTRVRIEYAGVAVNRELQDVFRRNVVELAEAGRLASVETAVKHDVYRDLGIMQGMMGA